MSAIRTVLVDDQPMMRAAMRLLLESSGIDVVAEGEDGADVAGLVDEHDPDVVLLDIRMPGMDGVEATRRLAEAGESHRVLILTTFDDDDLLHAALGAGAAGFLLKNAPPEDLVAAITRIAGGDGYLDPAVIPRVVARLGPVRADDDVLAPLTERERDVLWLLAQGSSNTELAARLDVSEATVKTHVSRLLAKLGVRDRVQAVVVAHRCGFADRARAIG